MNDAIAAGKYAVSWKELQRRLEILVKDVGESDRIYGIPRGGNYLVPGVVALTGCSVASHPKDATVFVDDVIDSGHTREKYCTLYPDAIFLALYDKLANPGLGWIVFPWEHEEESMGPEENIRRLLEFIGEDPNREGLRDTPRRVLKSYGELFAGYSMSPKDVMTVFEEDGSDEMIVCKNIEMASSCEHHMLPFVGVAHVAYIPNKKVIGLSKLARLVEIFARRLQIQERLTNQVADALMEHLQPLGAACIVEAKHLCMQCRGVNKQHSSMITSCLRGVFKEQAVKDEFIKLAGY